MAWAICEASRPIAMTRAGEAARPLVSSKHFPPKAGGSGGIHAKRMKHDRHVSIYTLPQGGNENPAATDAAMRGAAQRRTSAAHWSRRSMRRSVETLRAERSDGWASAAVAEPVARVPGASQSCGLRVCPLAGSLARGRVKFRRDGRAHKRSREPAGAD